MASSNDIHLARRARYFASMGADAVAVFPSAPVALRNNDVEHAYRQDSDLYWLTGYDEPESVLVLSTTTQAPRAVLFVRPRDPARETWDGPRAGLEGAVDRFGADVAHPIAELGARLPDYIEGADTLHYRLGVNAAFDPVLIEALRRVRARGRAAGLPPRQVVDPAFVLHEMRLRKDDAELALMRRAADISVEAHLAAMAVTRAGAFEYEIEAEIARVFRRHGAERPAYDPIVGSGPNATILHHRRNDRRMDDGELLLVDAGCEYGYYASDITRTWPVSGRFSGPQRDVYEVVLDAQRAAIDACVAGETLDAIHAKTVGRLVDGMVQIGLLSGPTDQLIEEGTYKRYYMHRTSHWLGMDVHDVGAYQTRERRPRPLEPGMVLTVEPGIYVAADDDRETPFRGIGVRIEDDIVVTGGAPVVLTAGVPKDVAAIEANIGLRAGGARRSVV